MAKRGRPPKLKALKKLEGNPGKRSLDYITPEPEPGDPMPPEWLDGPALDEWKRLSPIIAAMKILTPADSNAFALLCQALSEYAEAVMELSKTDNMGRKQKIIKTPNGYPVPSPWYFVRNKAFEQIKDMFSRFGLSPLDRERLRLSPRPDGADAADDPMGAFLKRGKKGA